MTDSASTLDPVLAGLLSGQVKILDLTNILSADTPTLTLPEPFLNLDDFALHPAAAFNDKAPFWAYNNFSMGEHIGTHVDAPAHWISGRDGKTVDEIAPQRLIGEAMVLDFSAEAAADPDWCLDVADIEAWEKEHGTFSENSWILLRTGWDQYANNEEAFLNADETGSHTPGITVEAAKYLSSRPEVSGYGVETVGIDASNAGGFDPPFPMHYFLLGADKYGVTSLQNLDKLPPRGALLVVAPLPILDGTAAPARVFALTTHHS